MNDLPLLCWRELALIIIVSGAVNIFLMGYDIFLVVDVVVIVVCSGLQVVRHYCGASRYAVCCGKASRKLGLRQWVQVLQDTIICSGGPVRPAAKQLVGFRRHRGPGKIPRPATPPIRERRSHSSQQRLQDCGELQKQRDVFWALAGGCVWGQAWHVETPH